MQLDSPLRVALYAVFAWLFATGAAWLVADALKEGASGELWQTTAANLLMLHGGGGMIILVLFGALFPLHVRRGWRAHRNRLSGSAMVTCNVALAVTAFGLYYAGGETLRAWLSNGHIGFGFALPMLIFVHVLLGRRSAQNQPGVGICTTQDQHNSPAARRIEGTGL